MTLNDTAKISLLTKDVGKVRQVKHRASRTIDTGLDDISQNPLIAIDRAEKQSKRKNYNGPRFMPSYLTLDEHDNRVDFQHNEINRAIKKN